MKTINNKECTVYLDHNKREIQHHGTTDFPCAAYAATFSNTNGDDIPWHWHEEMELIFIKNGSLELQTPSNRFILKCGEVIFINSGVLHYAIAAPTCTIHSIVFHSNLICGNDNDIFYKKYIGALMNDFQLESKLFDSPDTTANSLSNTELLQIQNCFDISYAGLTNYQSKFIPQDGIEFIIRENLSRICVSIWSLSKKELSSYHGFSSIDTLRSKKMLEFIHSNFSKKITLNDIANSANISSRECLRCFKKIIKTSPILYLLKYRLNQAAIMLLDDPAKTISDIAFRCGFNNSSYFTKIFILHFNISPKEFRKSHK